MTVLSDLFRVEYGNKFDMNKMTPTSNRLDGVAFVGRRGGLTGKSGVVGYVSPYRNIEPYRAGLLTVALGGNLLSTYVQQRPFYTAQNVAVLHPLDDAMSLQERLYYAMCIKANAFRYSAFGREANRTLAQLEMPACPPSWVGDTQVPTVEGIARPAGSPIALTDANQWSEFRISSLFDVKKGRRVTKANRTPGSTRFVGASDRNNGVTDMCSLDPIFPAHSLTVPYNGSVGHAFYQDIPFFASDDVNVLVPKCEISRWAMFFIAVMIRHERFRYTYGYKWNKTRMVESSIRLPILASGDPDWDYMERFIRGLQFTASISEHVSAP